MLGGLIGGTMAWGLLRRNYMLELALLILACALATYARRGLGMLISGRVRMDSEFFVWAGCVAYAMIAGLVVRILLLPTGTLAQTPLPERLIAWGWRSSSTCVAPEPVSLGLHGLHRAGRHDDVRSQSE